MGYDPEVALCDLIDNSIDAKASEIAVTLVAEKNEDAGETDTIQEFVIADNGAGMNRDTLINAFTLGSDREYPQNALGKFGLGLKAAGLSLGGRITLTTKTAEMDEPVCGVLTLRDVEDSGKYEIGVGAPDEAQAQRWKELAGSPSSGTLLTIDQVTDNKPAFSAFLDYLRRYCSITYHMFLEGELSLRVNGQALKPLDPLFMRDAEANGALGVPQEWDGRSVRLLMETRSLGLEEGVQCQIASTHLVHPPSFGADRDDARNRYCIESDPYTRRARHGFYVYRNKRIIVMAERFHGIVSSQQAAWAFRARLMCDEKADQILSLDVKKRHCQLPTKARSNLKALISTSATLSTEAWKVAGKRVSDATRDSKERIGDQSIIATPVPSLDYAPGADLGSDATLTLRKDRQAEVGQLSLEAIQDPKVTAETLNEPGKSVVTQVQGLKANAMWLPYPNVAQGSAHTLVNKAHSWVVEAYAAAEEAPSIAVVLHQMFTILARAELEVRSTPWNDMSTETVEKVLDRFRRKASAIAEDLADSLAATLESNLEEND